MPIAKTGKPSKRTNKLSAKKGSLFEVKVNDEVVAYRKRFSQCERFLAERDYDGKYVINDRFGKEVDSGTL